VSDADRPILITAYEPSGDALAASVVAGLRHDQPGRPIVGMGGDKMAAAGVRLIEHTTSRAAMLGDALGEVREHRRRTAVLKGWLERHRPALVVPTDSPAANWATCVMTRRLHPDTPVMHLAAPQLWAWAPWRVRKMRRLSDGVLCLLPFEPAWFEARGVPATFVGHPIFDRLADRPPRPLPWPAAMQPPSEQASVLAVLPGSRRKEVTRNLPDMLRAIGEVVAAGIDVRPIVALHDESHRVMVTRLLKVIDPTPCPVPIVVGRTPDVLAAADAALTVSGTATLQVAAQGVPMVIVYRVGAAGWHAVGRWIIKTRTFTLPNLIGQHLGRGDRVCPELVPHFGGSGPIAAALGGLLADPDARSAQRAAFEAIAGAYRGVAFADAATTALLHALRQGRPQPRIG
jgi:lipid-A-disaccharide synthase